MKPKKRTPKFKPTCRYCPKLAIANEFNVCEEHMYFPLFNDDGSPNLEPLPTPKRNDMPNLKPTEQYKKWPEKVPVTVNDLIWDDRWDDLFKTQRWHSFVLGLIIGLLIINLIV